MAARFDPLRDHRIHAMRFEPTRFLDRRCRRQDFRSEGFHPRQQFGGRESEMKTDDRGPEFIEDVRGLRVERSTGCTRGNCLRIDAEVRVVGREHSPPARFALGIRNGRRVTEEVDVVWMVGVRPDERELPADAIGSEHGARERAQSTGVADRHRVAYAQIRGQPPLQLHDEGAAVGQPAAVKPIAAG